MKRCFLFLQGPDGVFFRKLGEKLKSLGHEVIRVNTTGGDFFDWPWPNAVSYRGRHVNWPAWIAKLMRERGVTDIFMLSEWRPRHIETADLAKNMGIQVHVFEEGYLRPYFITLERDGVNGASPLPRDAKTILDLAAALPEPKPPLPLPSHFNNLARRTIYSLVARYALWPFWPFSKTHRPISGFSEYVLGWLPRLPGIPKRRRLARERLGDLYASGKPFFLFPLQIDADAQIRRYSPFSSGMPEGICRVLTSFAAHAPQNCVLLIKNHPLDYGLINYGKYIDSMRQALNLGDRVIYVEDGDGDAMTRASLGLVTLNSTMGFTALQTGKPVYYLGRSIASFAGLGAALPAVRLEDFWKDPVGPEPALLAAFLKLVRHQALINGDFHSPEGQQLTIAGVLTSLGL